MLPVNLIPCTTSTASASARRSPSAGSSGSSGSGGSSSSSPYALRRRKRQRTLSPERPSAAMNRSSSPLSRDDDGDHLMLGGHDLLNNVQDVDSLFDTKVAALWCRSFESYVFQGHFVPSVPKKLFSLLAALPTDLTTSLFTYLEINEICKLRRASKKVKRCAEITLTRVKVVKCTSPEMRQRVFALCPRVEAVYDYIGWRNYNPMCFHETHDSTKQAMFKSVQFHQSEIQALSYALPPSPSPTPTRKLLAAQRPLQQQQQQQQFTTPFPQSMSAFALPHNMLQHNPTSVSPTASSASSHSSSSSSGSQHDNSHGDTPALTLAHSHHSTQVFDTANLAPENQQQYAAVGGGASGAPLLAHINSTPIPSAIPVSPQSVSSSSSASSSPLALARSSTHSDLSSDIPLPHAAPQAPYYHPLRINQHNPYGTDADAPENSSSSAPPTAASNATSSSISSSLTPYEQLQQQQQQSCGTYPAQLGIAPHSPHSSSHPSHYSLAALAHSHSHSHSHTFPATTRSRHRPSAARRAQAHAAAAAAAAPRPSRKRKAAGSARVVEQHPTGAMRYLESLAVFCPTKVPKLIRSHFPALRQVCLSGPHPQRASFSAAQQVSMGLLAPPVCDLTLLATCRQLDMVSLRDMQIGMSDSEQLRTMGNLKIVILSVVSFVAPDTLPRLLEVLPKQSLEEFRFSQWLNPNIPSPAHLHAMSQTLLQFKNIRVIDHSFCMEPQLQFDSPPVLAHEKTLLESLPKLRALPSKLLSSKAIYGAQVPTLEHLQFLDVRVVHPAHFKILPRKCPALKMLFLDLYQLSAAQFHEIAMQTEPLPQVRALRIEPVVPLVSIDKFLKLFPGLVDLVLFVPSMWDRRACQTLVRSLNTRLKMLTLTGCTIAQIPYFLAALRRRHVKLQLLRIFPIDAIGHQPPIVDESVEHLLVGGPDLSMVDGKFYANPVRTFLCNGLGWSQCS